MIHVDTFVNSLHDSGVTFFTGVPDSLLKSFCAYVTDNCGDNHVIAANEGGAIGLAAGHYLATGKPALVYMQNSGQGNAGFIMGSGPSDLSGCGLPENGIIFVTAMAEKKLENDEVRYSAAYHTGAERCHD